MSFQKSLWAHYSWSFLNVEYVCKTQLLNDMRCAMCDGWMRCACCRWNPVSSVLICQKQNHLCKTCYTLLMSTEFQTYSLWFFFKAPKSFIYDFISKRSLWAWFSGLIFFFFSLDSCTKLVYSYFNPMKFFMFSFKPNPHVDAIESVHSVDRISNYQQKWWKQVLFFNLQRLNSYLNDLIY